MTVATEALAPAAHKAGRHRSEAVDRGILEATIALLREHGYEGLTMLAVIERAGVSSASLYRRWGSKQALVVAALESLTVENVTADTGSLSGDLTALAERSARVLDDYGPLFGRLTSELHGNDDVLGILRERLVEPRIDEIRRILRSAKERGELVARRPLSAEETLSLLTGPLHHRALVLGQPLSNAFVRAAVRQTLNVLTSADRS